MLFSGAEAAGDPDILFRTHVASKICTKLRKFDRIFNLANLNPAYPSGFFSVLKDNVNKVIRNLKEQ